ncbi:MAG: 50S ribosomal protein L25 [Bryobacter sp.]|nr:50S ribosomal protein L25 [Bryobacter sp.]
MRKDITLVADLRETRGKNAARRLRVAKKSPAVIYGIGQDPQAVTVDPKEVNKILHSDSGHNTIFNLDVAGALTPVMIKDWQSHPLKSHLVHVDFQRIDLSKKLTARVSVLTTGEPFGVKTQGGLYEMVNREIVLEVLPDEIPANFTVDVRELKLGEALRAKDIPLTGSMRLLSDPESVISHVVAPKVEEVTAASAAEPEVAKKGKKDADAAGGDKAKKK